jgi:hypothetical protein
VKLRKFYFKFSTIKWAWRQPPFSESVIAQWSNMAPNTPVGLELGSTPTGVWGPPENFPELSIPLSEEKFSHLIEHRKYNGSK